MRQNRCKSEKIFIVTFSKKEIELDYKNQKNEQKKNSELNVLEFERNFCLRLGVMHKHLKGNLPVCLRVVKEICRIEVCPVVKEPSTMRDDPRAQKKRI